MQEDEAAEYLLDDDAVEEQSLRSTFANESK